MNRSQLDARNTAAICRWWVTMRDTGGRPPQQLLDDLAEVAEDHRDQALALADAAAEANPAVGARVKPSAVAKALDDPPAPRRRQPARRSTK